MKMKMLIAVSLLVGLVLVFCGPGWGQSKHLELTKAAAPAVAEYLAGKTPAPVTTAEDVTARLFEALAARDAQKPELGVALLDTIPAEQRTVFVEYWTANLAADPARKAAAVASAERIYAAKPSRTGLTNLMALHGWMAGTLNYDGAKLDALVRRFAPEVSAVRLVAGLPTVTVNAPLLVSLTRLYVRAAGKLDAKALRALNDYLFEVVPMADETADFLRFLADQQKRVVAAEN